MKMLYIEAHPNRLITHHTRNVYAVGNDSNTVTVLCGTNPNGNGHTTRTETNNNETKPILSGN